MIDFKISPGTGGNSDIPERFDDLPNHDISVFQSENIQNILDARLDTTKPVEINYKITKLDLGAVKNLKANLGNEFFKKLKESFLKSDSQDIEDQVRKVKLALNNEHKWFSLSITEKNTTGLLGSETGEVAGSKYHALMRHNNRSEKDDIGGGTFGKGSSVYTYSSGLWIWFAYSVLSKKDNNSIKRFSGRGMIAPFADYNNRRFFNGPLWYARPEPENNGFPHQGLPYVNLEADEHAERFGITKREENDYGTTCLIPVFWPDGIALDDLNASSIFRQLKEEIIKRWFVPIYNNDLKCSISIGNEETTTNIDSEYLNTIPELKFKLEILDWYNSGATQKDKRFKRKLIKAKLPLLTKDQKEKIFKKYGKKIGHKQNNVELDLVVREISIDELPFNGFLDEDDAGTVNRIALIRNKGMIINHFPFIQRNKTDFINIAGDKKFEAILFAGKMSNLPLSEEERNHLELFLGYAENPAHNVWINETNDLHRCHLNRFSKNPTPFPVNRINGIFKDLYTSIIEIFPKDDKPPFKKDICDFWKNLYKIPSRGITPGGEIGFGYETIKEGVNSEGRYYWKIKFRSNGPSELIKLKVSHYLTSHERPITKKEEFEALGIPEFSELTLLDNGQVVDEILLEYDKSLKMAHPKEIEIITCPIVNNNIYRNLEPVIEVKSEI